MSILKQMVLQARGPVHVEARRASSLVRNPVPKSIQSLLNRGLPAARPRSDAPPRWHGTARLPHSQHIQHSQRLSAAATDAESPSAPAEEDETATSRFKARAGEISVFEALGVDDRVTGRLIAQGVVEPTDVQREAIPPILTGTDVAVQCYTGSGKTLAYLLPTLSLAIQRAEAEYEAAKVTAANQSRKQKREAGAARLGTVQAIIVVPSRELAMQIVRVAQSLLPEDARGAVQQCIGGANPHRQAESLRANLPVLVVGTPGRLAELSKEGVLQTHHTSMLVLDEADQLLAPHFRVELLRMLEHVGKKLPGGRQNVLVSATMSAEVLQQFEPWIPHPQRVFVAAANQLPTPRIASSTSEVGNEGEDGEAEVKLRPRWGWDATQRVQSASTPEAPIMSAPALPPQLDHTYVLTNHHRRVDTLRRTIHALDAQRVLVFMNYQHRLKDTQYKLESTGMAAACLHGEMSKMERQNVLAKFKAGAYRALIVSDVAARGLDIQECDAVVNLELPSDASAYAHRAGRTGRIGRQGSVVTIVTAAEEFVVLKMARLLNVSIPEVQVTHGQVILRGTTPTLPEN